MGKRLYGSYVSSPSSSNVCRKNIRKLCSGERLAASNKLCAVMWLFCALCCDRSRWLPNTNALDSASSSSATGKTDGRRNAGSPVRNDER